MAKEIVYILTNPSLAGWIKIGMTSKNDIAQRLKQLNNSEAIPLDFRVYALLRCDDAHKTESLIHRLFDAINPEIHAIEQRANGRVRKKEFFQIEPEKAYEVMETVVALAPDNYELVKQEATKEEKDIEDIVKEVAHRENRSRSTFKMVGIPAGTELEYVRDPQIKCVVVDDSNTVEYNGKHYSLSTLSWELQGRPNYGINGWYEFSYQGERLSERRLRLEAENGCEVF